MPRRRAAPKSVILPDPKYKDLLVSKFINSLMKHGKKSIAENIFRSENGLGLLNLVDRVEGY